ncbi:hypothetical protein DICPUDRAFT_75236 [Dictyostelium purpureum]|uniref:Uncharacterized protein n=1 Tax=Dictyostelium purpureum TaxID=5786 RepID=F0ZA28_DICPU|nr:uncharacterized protein DICPUDRAFT_75236 [Dictyostelium purpureum]EGC39222.1 hypothetical protein DICPUDRAFT_75236 [Dictyostelium purpureum]|eukprot:XP_003284249.1 hypothetical protein DICPUDRAFT_75236 [Dictyostelium purpureum]
MNYFSWMPWGKKKSDENTNLNDNIKSNTETEKIKDTAPTSETSNIDAEKNPQKTTTTNKTTQPKKEKTLDERKFDMVDLIVDPPINHVKMTPELYESLANVGRNGTSPFTPSQSLWLNGIVGGSIGYIISNSIFKNNPLVRFRNTMIFSSTFLGAYYFSNNYFKASKYDHINFLYKKDSFIRECDVYFSNEILPYIIEKDIKDSKYRITSNGDIVDPETSEVVLKNYNGSLKKFFNPLNVD